MKHKRITRLISLLLVMATLFGTLSLTANAASLADSGTVTKQQEDFPFRRQVRGL